MTIRNRKISQVRLDKDNVDAPTINRALDNIINTVNPWVDEATKAINNLEVNQGGGTGISSITINPESASPVSGDNFNLEGGGGITFASNGSDTITINQSPITVAAQDTAGTGTGNALTFAAAGGLVATRSGTTITYTGAAQNVTINSQTGSINGDTFNIVGEGCCIHTETSGSDTLKIVSDAPCEFMATGSSNLTIQIPVVTVISGAQPNTLLLAHLDTNYADSGDFGSHSGGSWGSTSGVITNTNSKFGAGSFEGNGTSNSWLNVDTTGQTSSLGLPYLKNAQGTFGDFTLEWWMYPIQTTTIGNYGIMTIAGATAAGFSMRQYLGQLIAGASYAGTPLGVYWTAQTWHAFALCRKDNVLRLYLDGTLIYTWTNLDLGSDVSGMIFNWSIDSYYQWSMQGNTDEIRYSDVAYYTGSSYTPATQAFPNFSGVPITYTDFCARQFSLNQNVSINSITASAINVTSSNTNTLTASVGISSPYANITTITGSNISGSNLTYTNITASNLSASNLIAPMFGDVTGTIQNNRVTKWQGLPVANVSNTIANGEIYTWNNTENQWATYQGSNTIDNNVIVQLPMSGTNGSTTFTNLAPVALAVTAYGGVAVTSSVEKWAGSGSAYFDSSGDYLAAPYTSSLVWGNNDWTAEWWMNPETGYGSGGFSIYAGGLVDFRSTGGSAGYLVMITTSGNVIVWWAGGPQLLSSVSTIPVGSWTNVVVQKRSGVLEIYINGTLDASVANTYTQTDGELTVGSTTEKTTNFLQYKGYLSDLRISNIARYTTSFSAPTAPYPNPNVINATSNIGGDISGTLNNITVTGLQGIPLTSSAPADGNIIVYDSGSGKWNNQNTRWYGSFFNSGSITASAINTAYAIPLPNNNSSNGVSIQNNSEITFAHGGTYNIQATYQVVKGAGASVEQAYLWLRETGSNVPNSNYNQHIKDTNHANQVVSALWTRTMSSGSHLELYWATTDTDISLHGEPATLLLPETPSVIVSISQV